MEATAVHEALAVRREVEASIPTIDISALGAADPAGHDAVVEALGAAAEADGFALVVGHGIEPATIAAAFAAGRLFFELPDAYKRSIREKRSNRGYQPMYDNLRPDGKPSAQEGYTIGHPRPPSDPALLALLLQDENSGLQVGRGDLWIPVPPDPRAVVVNVGKMLRHWSGGRYNAALHRVVNRSGRDRYSIPLFVHPGYHTIVDPRALTGAATVDPHFPPIVAGETVNASFATTRKSWNDD